MAGFMGAERHIKSMPIDVDPLKQLLLSKKSRRTTLRHEIQGLYESSM